MELTPDILATGAVGVIVVVGAIGTYLRSRQQVQQAPNPVFSGVAGGLVEREQMERLIQEVAGIRKSIEAISDRRQTEMLDAVKEIAENLHHRR